jgi:hypothetical protein
MTCHLSEEQVSTKIIRSSSWYVSWYVSETPKPVMQHHGYPDVEASVCLADYLLEKWRTDVL